MASVFYSIGGVVVYSGPLAPVCLGIMALVLYPFTRIISEVSMAVPFNGGTYNIYLNSVSKSIACVVAGISLLDYCGMAVISASSAVSYLSPDLPASFPVFWLTVGILVLFALVSLFGARDSASLALIIFLFHCLTLLVLSITSVVYICVHTKELPFANNLLSVKQYSFTDYLYALFYGFSIGLLSATGIETSSNYIEEQRPEVFAKTIWNMWLSLAIFFPMLALFVIMVIPLSAAPSVQSFILSVLADRVGGTWLKWLVVLDAVLVLCAGVLTGFVGIQGLVSRLASDGVLPEILLQKNRIFRTNHWIILSFLLFAVSLYGIGGGDTFVLSVIYTTTLVLVLIIFAIGNLLLKYARGRLSRTLHVRTGIVMLVLLALIVALVGNLLITPVKNLYFTLLYFAVCIAITQLTSYRVKFARAAYFYVDKVVFLHRRWPGVVDGLVRAIKNWTSKSVVFFSKSDEIYVLNKAVLYAIANENAGCLKIVHIVTYQMESDPRETIANRIFIEKLKENRRILDELYPKITIDLVIFTY